MAILYPQIDLIQRQKVQPTEGELTLLNFLMANLDDSYEIFYQPFLNGDNPDFAIMRKGSGVLLIEVKDWELKHYYIDGDTNWHLQKDDTRIKSPLSQVDNYKWNLFYLHIEELFQRKIENNNLWVVVNCAVYFHNAKEIELNEFLLGNFQAEKYKSYKNDVNHFGLLGKDSLTKEKLNLLLNRFWLNKGSYYFDNILYNSFKRYLKPPIHQMEDGIQITYTKEQQELIRSEIRPRRKIKGVAGSGKTLVLAKRAVNGHKRTENKVLILTFNLSLKNYIKDKINDVREDFNWGFFYITNYHQFFKTEANNYNLEIKSLDSWQDRTFFEPVKDLIKKYDVILIDEIQDYQQSWLDIITTYFVHAETEFVVFGDEKQNIYERELDDNNEPIVRTVPGIWNKSLNTSYRFASNIGNIAIQFQRNFFDRKYSIDDLNVMSQLDFEKRIIEYHYFHTFTPDILFHSIYDVLLKNQIHSSDTAILCSKIEILRALDFSIRTIKNEKTTIAFESQEEYEKYQDINIIKDIRRFKKNHFYMKTGTIKLSTVHSFKGWEIDTLFLFIEKEENNKEFTNSELIYTGLTRARRNLIIFNLDNNKYDNFFKNGVDAIYEYK